MTDLLDVLFVNSNSSRENYQDLASNFSAIEPPTWSLLLAEATRKKGFNVDILDCDAERLQCTESVNRINKANARLVLFVVYGQNPNSSTANMSGAIQLAENLKKSNKDSVIAFLGAHVAALPREVLSYHFVDIVFTNEGVYSLINLLNSDLDKNLKNVKGIGYKKNGLVEINEPEKVVPQERMDEDLPGYAWDLLPFKEKPLDLYRAHYWHSNFSESDRGPFAAIYTSLGCNFKCEFCMINIINRNNNSEQMSAADFSGMRFWSVSWVIKEMQKLSDLGVRHLRIVDEMFFLNKKYYVPLLDEIIAKGFNFNMWAYARCDTVRIDQLERFKKAGINWLALGVESGSYEIRQYASKGSFKTMNLKELFKVIEKNGINIISNYIFGLTNDSLETMTETYNLALDLNTEMINMYPCQALPGSPLYTENRELLNTREDYRKYSFFSYECEPLPTSNCSSAEILEFRDKAWNNYMNNKKYLKKIEKKFGFRAVENIKSMASIKLKRKLLEENFNK